MQGSNRAEATGSNLRHDRCLAGCVFRVPAPLPAWLQCSCRVRKLLGPGKRRRHGRLRGQTGQIHPLRRGVIHCLALHTCTTTFQTQLLFAENLFQTPGQIVFTLGFKQASFDIGAEYVTKKAAWPALNIGAEDVMRKLYKLHASFDYKTSFSQVQEDASSMSGSGSLRLVILGQLHSLPAVNS